MKKNIRILSICILILVIPAFTAAVFFIYQASPLTSVKKERAEQIAVPAGMKTRSLADLLEQKRLIRSGTVFYLAARYPLLGKLAGCGTFTLESGMFRIKSSMSTADIFELVSSGKDSYVRVSIPEGLTISKIGQRLEKAGICSAVDFKAAANDKTLIAKYNIQGTSLEGYLFPDTYFFTPGLGAPEAADIMVGNFFNHVKQIPELSALSGAEFKQTVILASIVEREYRVDSEAPLIASVFINRIKKHIGLYSCATIEYIITEIQGQPHPDVITYKDLKINSPYNTYKWAALPPGPISNPGMVALSAAAKPARTNYYYFRLIDPETGRHAFSTDFNEHIKEGTLYHTKK